MQTRLTLVVPAHWSKHILNIQHIVPKLNKFEGVHPSRRGDPPRKPPPPPARVPPPSQQQQRVSWTQTSGPSTELRSPDRSPSSPFSNDQGQPSIVVFDNAGKLHAYCLNRNPDSSEIHGSLLTGYTGSTIKDDMMALT